MDKDLKSPFNWSNWSQYLRACSVTWSTKFWPSESPSSINLYNLLLWFSNNYSVWPISLIVHSYKEKLEPFPIFHSFSFLHLVSCKEAIIIDWEDTPKVTLTSIALSLDRLVDQLTTSRNPFPSSHCSSVYTNLLLTKSIVNLRSLFSVYLYDFPFLL